MVNHVRPRDEGGYIADFDVATGKDCIMGHRLCCIGLVPCVRSLLRNLLRSVSVRPELMSTTY